MMKKRCYSSLITVINHVKEIRSFIELFHMINQKEPHMTQAQSALGTLNIILSEITAKIDRALTEQLTSQAAPIAVALDTTTTKHFTTLSQQINVIARSDTNPNIPVIGEELKAIIAFFKKHTGNVFEVPYEEARSLKALVLEEVV